MRVSIFGMGYVGCVTAACLIKQGHNVIGVDVVDSKVKKLNNGIWPIYEPGLDELNSPKIIKSNFTITANEEKALSESEISLICVGTPSTVNGNVELKYLQTIISNISNFLINNNKNHIVLIRSTIPPGTTKKLVSSHFKELKEKVKIGFLPEFLREGSAIADFFNPSLKIIGCEKDFPVNMLDKIFSDVKGEWIVTKYEIAESILDTVRSSISEGNRSFYNYEYILFYLSLSLNLDKNFNEAYFFLAQIYQNLKNYSKAEQFYSKVNKNHSLDLESQINIARNNSHEENFDKAEKDLIFLLKSNTGNESILIALAVAARRADGCGESNR